MSNDLINRIALQKRKLEKIEDHIEKLQPKSGFIYEINVNTKNKLIEDIDKLEKLKNDKFN